MKNLLKFIATIMIAIGLWLGTIGFSYQAEYAAYRQFSVPMAQPLVDRAKRIPNAVSDLLLFPEYGLLPLFGGAAGAFIIVGLFISVIANREKKSLRGNISKKNARIKLPSSQRVETPPPPDDDTAISDDFAAPHQQQEALADDIETYDSFEDLLDINTLISMSQSYLEQDTCLRVLQMFRPDFLDHKDIISEESIYEITKQILESVILRHRRQEKDITSDQFRIQDRRLVEIERKTIARRYMPSSKNISAKTRKYLGRVYDFNTQSEIQQNYLSESEDWVDLSLRNAKEVLSMSLDDRNNA